MYCYQLSWRRHCTSDHKTAGSSPASDKVQFTPEYKTHLIADSIYKGPSLSLTIR